MYTVQILCVDDIDIRPVAQLGHDLALALSVDGLADDAQNLLDILPLQI